MFLNLELENCYNFFFFSDDDDDDDDDDDELGTCRPQEVQKMALVQNQKY